MARKPKATEIAKTSTELVELTEDEKLIKQLRESGRWNVSGNTFPVIPAQYDFPAGSKEFVQRALHAGLELSGGAPLIISWFIQHPNKAIPAYLKAFLETGEGGGSAVATANVMNIVTGVAPSAFDGDNRAIDVTPKGGTDE